MLLGILSAFALLLFSAHRCPAQPAPAPPPSDESQGYLEGHNQARSAVGVGPMTWSPALAKSASLTARLQRDRQNCSFANLANSRYGGNQLWASGYEVKPRAAVDTWVEEKKFYNYDNNSCAPDHHCGVYTQVVWKKSLELGCAQATCRQSRSSLTICFYNPPGNIVGEKPY